MQLNFNHFFVYEFHRFNFKVGEEFLRFGTSLLLARGLDFFLLDKEFLLSKACLFNFACGIPNFLNLESASLFPLVVAFD